MSCDFLYRFEELRNKLADAWLNDMMVCYIERGLFGLDLTEIKKEFQKKKEECHCQALHPNKALYGYVFVPTTRFI